MKTTTYIYHHTGIPTTTPHEGGKYSPTFDMWTSGGNNSAFRIQYHRFGPNCPLHPLIQSKQHIAFLVPSLLEAIKGKEVILEPYEPFSGFKVAMINEEGMPIEFIETTVTEEEIGDDETHKNSKIYPGKSAP